MVQIVRQANPLAAVLRENRRRAGFTQDQLAHMTQLTVRAIANIESGRVLRPHESSIRKLVAALQLSRQDLETIESWRRRVHTVSRSAPVAETRKADRMALIGPVREVRQLPTDISHFTGRHQETLTILDRLSAGRRDPPIVVVSGPGGIGKTALAVHVAHSVLDGFPDGQLFADLGGLATPRRPGEILGHFLRALGVGGRGIPHDLEARAAVYRTNVSDRRILVVLDNAVDERQVRGLLPGPGACAAIVTGRAALSSLEPTTTIDLGLLSSSESLTLLAHLIGASRVRENAEAAVAIVQGCGGLPLAVRIVGGRLANRRGYSLAAFARRFADERYRLDQLRAGDLSVRASIGVGYAALAVDDQRALRRLGRLRLGSFSPRVLAPLIGADLYAATAIADRLAQRRMIEAVGVGPAGDPQYRCHDLVRLFAQERSETDH